MNRLTLEGTAEPVPRDQVLRRERRQVKLKSLFSCPRVRFVGKFCTREGVCISLTPLLQIRVQRTYECRSNANVCISLTPLLPIRVQRPWVYLINCSLNYYYLSPHTQAATQIRSEVVLKQHCSTGRPHYNCSKLARLALKNGQTYADSQAPDRLDLRLVGGLGERSRRERVGETASSSTIVV